MKLARFRVDGWESYGVVEGDRVQVIQGSIYGDIVVTQASYPLDLVKLLPPTQPTSFGPWDSTTPRTLPTRKAPWTRKESSGTRRFSGPGRRAWAASSATRIL